MPLRNKAITKEVLEKLTPNEVLQDFIEGNQRFVNDEISTINHKALIHQTKKEQFPKAIVLSCIDSRVPVELIFDQTIGDVFVARVAGNFENIDILGSMEYACKVVNSKLILVLGHEGCGAIKAVCDDIHLGHITKMLKNIKPALTQSITELQLTDNIHSKNENLVAKTVENNVLLTIQRIREKSTVLREMETNNEIKIVGGIYEVSTGKVRFL